MASCSCSPISLASTIFCSILTELRAALSCSSSLCLQQGRNSTVTFCSRFRQNLLCNHRLTFRSSSSRTLSFFSFSVVQGIPAIHFTAVMTAFLCVRNAIGTRLYIQLESLIGIRARGHMTLRAFIRPRRHMTARNQGINLCLVHILSMAGATSRL